MPKFVPRQRKHKVLARSRSKSERPHDSNQIQLVPESKSEREEKRQKLREELQAGQPRISSKKQKRLDKYIENKLRKDESIALLKKLEKAKVDTAAFQSSKHLGKRKFGEFAESRLLDPQPKLPETSDGALYPEENVSDVDSEDSFEEGNEDAFGQVDGRPHTILPTITVNTGSGLKAPLLVGDDGIPIIRERRNQYRRKAEVLSEKIPWEGFDTESSGLDSEEQARDLSDGISDSTDASTSEYSDQSEDDSDDDSSQQSETSGVTSIKPRASAFKAWATQQVNQSLGHIPVYEQESFPLSRGPTHGIESRPPPVSQEIEAPSLVSDSTRKAFSVQIERRQSIQDSRLELPIIAEEQKIMEAINNNSVVLIWGATGSGKTTQLPQFLFEAGYGNPESETPGIIGITQPRRVAAVSMANRVKEELGQHGDKVAHQVRFDSSVSARTAIKYMTDGILLRELSQDVMLSKYSAIIIDEAHERSINTDVLIGMLSRIVPGRLKLSRTDSSVKPLKLIIMSATLRTSDFLQNPRLFKADPIPPPLVQAEGRQFQVTVHFSRRTKADYIEEVSSKIIKGHRKLPCGSMLVFLTGQSDIKAVKDILTQKLPSTGSGFDSTTRYTASSETPMETEDMEFGPLHGSEDIDDVNFITGLEDDDDDQLWEGRGDAFDLGEAPISALKIHVLPLYSQLPSKEQMKVFHPPPDGSRLIILATNIAETSLTIPGVRYVFDAGRSKERVFDHATGVQRFEINWISKASAEQRTGRAGRTEAGHCYRLYSSAVYERDFPQDAEPELLRTSIENVVLQLKSFHIENVLNFPFPTPPFRDSLLRAEALLKNLGALTAQGRVTPTGTKLSLYPVSPRLSKVLNVCIDQHPSLVWYAVGIAAALSVGEVFIPENQYRVDSDEPNLENEQKKKDQQRAHHTLSKIDPKADVVKLLTAVLKFETALDKSEFCDRMFIQAKPMQEVSQLRSQLTSIVRANNRGLSPPEKISVSSVKDCAALGQVMASGYIDQIAIRADLAPNPPEMLRKPQKAIDVPYLPLIPLPGHNQTLAERAVFLHPSSVLARCNSNELPTYIVYSHLQQTATGKNRMFPLAPVHAQQLSNLAHNTPLLSYSKPVGHKITTLGGNPQRRECWVIPSLIGSVGAIGWPLPARKVIQRKDASDRSGWIIEEFLS